ncbi:hypothetical protein [Adhaeribacter radiodurans]|uniref:Uncharacterized protein n=1 Tax=Adhaeribacter radiodurans TaxID=2745197 RepID=A0A7L7L8P1_9BACT|nr:hypothetical protein [Adhaeribacter radiodurans]QMU29202.1 hypothetical protein HUW48_14660 [Adhaeribacter radiodurans]
MKNTLSIFSLLLLLTGALWSCHTPPKFPIEPNISFKKVVPYHFTENGQPKDSIVVIIRFEDGDGDLGLTDADNQPPFNPTGPLVPNGPVVPQGEFFYNYFIKMFVKRNGQFEEFQFPSAGGLNGRFFPLAPDGRTGPLEGDLNYGIVIRPGRNFVPGDIVKFEVYIVDKQLHLSNKITTDEVALFQ